MYDCACSGSATSTGERRRCGYASVSMLRRHDRAARAYSSVARPPGDHEREPTTGTGTHTWRISTTASLPVPEPFSRRQSCSPPRIASATAPPLGTRTAGLERRSSVLRSTLTSCSKPARSTATWSVRQLLLRPGLRRCVPAQRASRRTMSPSSSSRKPDAHSRPCSSESGAAGDSRDASFWSVRPCRSRASSTRSSSKTVIDYRGLRRSRASIQWWRAMRRPLHEGHGTRHSILRSGRRSSRATTIISDEFMKLHANKGGDLLR